MTPNPIDIHSPQQTAAWREATKVAREEGLQVGSPEFWVVYQWVRNEQRTEVTV